MAVSSEILAHVYTALSGLKDGEVSGKAKDLASHYGVTVQTIFRWAAMKGLRWRRERKTKGVSRVPDHIIRQAGAMLLGAKRTSKKIPLPACDAKEILEDSGFGISVSIGRFLAVMRQKEISKADLLRPVPHVTLLSAHPNHIWQFDVTNCIQYFLDEKRGMGERDLELDLEKNKIVRAAKEIKKELLRYAVIDHCSGAFFFRYFYASGERAADGAQFLFEAMRPKDDLIERYWPEKAKEMMGKYRFHGVPFMLIADRGSIMAAKANQSLFESLKISVETHLPGNPRAKGAVEGLMNIINRFEARLKFQRPRDLDELNRWAFDWVIMYNAVKDMRKIAPRSILWSKIKESELRLCPDERLYRLLIRGPVIKRKATGARLISIDGNTYQIPDPNCVNQWVEVTRNAYEYPAVDVHFNGHVWLLKPIPVDEYGRLTTGVPYGEYRAIKHTETQRAKHEFEKIAEGWGITWKGTGDKRRAEAPPAGFESPLKVFGHQAEKVGNLSFIARKGTEMEVTLPEVPSSRPVCTDAVEVSRKIASRRVPITELFKRLKEEIGPIPVDLNQRLRARYGADIEIQEIEEVMKEMSHHAGGSQKEAMAG